MLDEVSSTLRGSMDKADNGKSTLEEDTGESGRDLIDTIDHGPNEVGVLYANVYDSSTEPAALGLGNHLAKCCLTKSTNEGSASWSERMRKSWSSGNCEALVTHYVDASQSLIQSEKAEQIAITVYSHVKTILDEVAMVDDKFKIAEILKVGSFYEGTKVLHPDEFDFLAVIDELSESGAIKVRSIKNLPGYAMIKLTHDSLKKRWKRSKEKKLLLNFQEPSEFGSFSLAVLTVLENMSKMQDLTYCFNKDRGYGEISDKGLAFQAVNKVNLTLKAVSTLNPNFYLHFDIDGKAVDVDLSTAIRHYNVLDCFDRDNCSSTRLAEAVMARGSILLVNQDSYSALKVKNKETGHLFRISFTETEAQAMRDTVWEHKQLYIFLKMFKTIFQEVVQTQALSVYVHLTSYILKMACLTHDSSCSSPKLTCLFDIVCILEDYFKTDTVRSVFNVKQNVFSRQKTFGDVVFFKALFNFGNSVDSAAFSDKEFQSLKHLKVVIAQTIAQEINRQNVVGAIVG